MTLTARSFSISAAMLIASAGVSLAQQGVTIAPGGANNAAVKAGNAAAAGDTAVVVSDPNVLGAIGSPQVAGANRIGYVSDDLCAQRVKLTAQFSSNVSGGSIITGVSSTKIFICAMDIGTAAAANISLTEGTGTSSCGTNTAAVWGNTSSVATNGWPFAANGGLVKGSGAGTVAQTATAGDNLCALFTTSSMVNISISYVQSS